MNKEEFIKFIKSPGSLDKESLEMFDKIVTEFPYFQTARLLFLRNLQNIKSSTTKSELKKAATHISNRQKLFLLLKDIDDDREKKEEKTSDDFPSNEVIKKEDQTEQKTDDKKEILSDVISQRLNEIEKGSDSESEPDDDSKVVKEKSFGHIADTILKKAAEQKRERESSADFSEEETNIEESNVISSNVDLLVIDDNEQINKDQKMEENLSEKAKDTSERENKELLMLEGNEEISSTHYDKSMKLLFSHKVNILDLKLPTELSSDEEQDEGEKEDLIGKFIESNPSIKRNLESEYGIEHLDISEKSVQENEEYLTDTLVDIYIKQGYYTKAILAYEKLSLKYPEKSSYFAKQIEKIKKLNNKS